MNLYRNFTGCRIDSMAVPPGSSDPELLLWQVTGKVRNSTPKQVDNLMIPLNALVTFHHGMGNTLAAFSPYCLFFSMEFRPEVARSTADRLADDHRIPLFLVAD